MSTSAADFFAHVGAVVTGVAPVAYLVFRKLKGLAAMTPAASKILQDLDAAADAVVTKINTDAALVDAATAAGAAQADAEMVAGLQPILAKLQAIVPPAPSGAPASPSP